METNMNNSGDSRHRFAGPQKSRSPRKGAQNMQNIPHIIRAATPPSTLADVVIERPHRPRPNAFTVRVLFFFFCLFFAPHSSRFRCDSIRFAVGVGVGGSSSRTVWKIENETPTRRASDETKRKKKKNKRKSHSTRIERERETLKMGLHFTGNRTSICRHFFFVASCRLQSKFSTPTAAAAAAKKNKKIKEIRRLLCDQVRFCEK